MSLTVDEATVAAEEARREPVPAQGSVLGAEEAFPVAATNSLDPRNACSRTLEAFLRCAMFVRAGGNAPDTLFRLDGIQHVWPDPEDLLCYPAASIIDASDIPYEAHAFAPTALVDTWNLFSPDTVLWKTAELVCEFQVDFWAVDDPTLEEAYLAFMASRGRAEAATIEEEAS